MSPVRKTTRLAAVQVGGDGGKRLVQLFQRPFVELLINVVLQCFALEQAASAQRPVGKDFFIELDGDFLDGVSIVAAGIECANDCAGAGADNEIRDDALRFQHLDHADMGEAAGCTTAKGQADFGFLDDRNRCRRCRRFSGKAGTAGQDEGKDDREGR